MRANLIGALAAEQGRRARFAVHPAPLRPLPEVPALLAGAAEVDLTPPPGMPKAGYSRNGRDGAGFRTRLRARVVHLRCGTVSLALVTTDLLGGSPVLQHLVADRVAADTDVRLGGLFLSATHTHGAPAQFHGSDFYNRFSSNRAGFEPAWAAFVAERIAAAVSEAVRVRRPAALAWGRTRVEGLTRNRSLAAFRLNPGRERESAGTAVNPFLDLLRVDGLAADGGTEPLAAVVLFSVHGTAVPMTTRTYNADLWAYLVDELADRVSADRGRRPVTGAMQGTHGDVTPALDGAAGHPEAARIGRGIGAEAAALYATLDRALDRAPALAFGFREVDLRDRPDPSEVRMPRRAAVGAALLAGAVENATPYLASVPPFRPGSRKPGGGHGPHGGKWVVGSRLLQPLVLPSEDFPRVLPVHLVRVGEVLLTGIPMEITTESGDRFAEVAAAAWNGARGAGGPVRAVVASVVDEYAGYCTTSQEYAAQFYEGGHTIYGPLTQRFLAERIAALARATARRGQVQQVPAVRGFDLAVRRYLPPATGREVTPRSLGAPRRLTRAGGGPERVEWRWLGPAPGDVAWHEPLVRVEHRRPDGLWEPVPLAGGTVLDDGRGELEVVHLGPSGVDHRYAVRWWDDGTTALPQLPRSGGRHRFALAQGPCMSADVPPG